MSLEIIPVTQKKAKEYISEHHRHHKAPLGSIFQIGCTKNGHLCGVVMVGRPVARMLQDGQTLEVNRLCTDGTKNACSKLYSAAWKAAQALGWKRLITYILETENGASLKASGFQETGRTQGGSWSHRKRKRVDKHPLCPKKRYEIWASNWAEKVPVEI